MLMRRIWWTLTAILVVFLAALWVDYPGTSQVFGRSVTVNKGIDLAGGARLLMCTPKNVHPTSDQMNTARDIINQRAAGGYGVTEPQVTRVGSTCISVEMPGLTNQDALIQRIGQTGYLALTDSSTTPLAAGTKVQLVCKT